MITVFVDNVHKWIVEPVPGTDAGVVVLYENMGGRWVALGAPERWSNELIKSELGIDLERGII